ncbi:HopJ type III effector protein [Chryseobacterium sp. legu1]|nr:HopJ type III effector protein [Chryseobacterium sp.]
MNQQTLHVNGHQNIRNFLEFGWDGISFEGNL